METLETPIAHPIPPNFNPINHKHPSYVKLHMGTWTFRKLRASECLEPQHSLTLNPEPKPLNPKPLNPEQGCIYDVSLTAGAVVTRHRVAESLPIVIISLNDSLKESTRVL